MASQPNYQKAPVPSTQLLTAGLAKQPIRLTTADPASSLKIVQSGGGLFRGIQPGFQSRTKYIEALVLFDDAAAPYLQRSTICCPLSQLTVERVQAEIQRKRNEYLEVVCAK